MRVSCIFVSVAVLLAQQASAAPVIGLPALPLLDGEGRLVNGLSDTLGPIPIAGPLVGDLLESKSRGGLLSTLDVTGKYGLINDHGFASDLGRSLFDRRDEVPIAGPILDKFPIVNQILSAIPFDAIHGLDLIESLPGVSEVESIESSIPIPNFGKRSGGVPIIDPLLDQLPGGEEIEAMLPGLDAIESLPGVDVVESIERTIAAPHFLKRSENLGGIPFLGSMGGLGGIPGLGGLGSLGGLGGLGGLKGLGGLRGLGGLGGLSGLSGLSGLGGLSGRPSLPSLPFKPSFGGLSGLSSVVPGLSNIL